MQPLLYEDNIVIVHKQDDIESGQIGIKVSEQSLDLINNKIKQLFVKN